MFKVIRDLLKYDGRFRVACVFLGAVAVMMLLSFVSAEDPNKTFVTAMDLPPSLEHIFGTSSRGQDIFWWMTFAVRNSILIAAVAAIVSRIIAIFVGLTAGYRGGGKDMAHGNFRCGKATLAGGPAGYRAPLGARIQESGPQSAMPPIHLSPCCPCTS